MGKRMRLPNGYGSVYKLSGNRRRPYAVAITVGWDNRGKQLNKIIDYTETRQEGLMILANYHKDPFDIDLKNITFNDIFEKIEILLKKSVENNKMSESNYRNIISTYKNQLKPIHKKEILETKKKELQTLINTSNVGYTTRGYIKNVLTRIFSYAIDELELPIQKNIAERLEIGEKEKSTLHTPFISEEVHILWVHQENEIIKIILISLYTGLRPKEVLGIKKEKTFITDDYIIAGCKTKAGTDRFIPIHKDIKSLIKYFYYKDNDSEYLITFENTNKPYNEDTYRDKFKAIIREFGFKHTPYDTRHSFATQCDICGISETNIKVLMGHSLNGDVTNHVYIHKSIELLKQEINKLKY